MSDMIERVARAICAKSIPCIASWCTPDDMVATLSRGFVRRWALHEPEARAAIEAMREPTEAMLNSYGQFFASDRFGEPEYRAMIDAALASGSSPK